MQRFLVGSLCDLSAEHDFMLGVLLGYDRERRCSRDLARADTAALLTISRLLADEVLGMAQASVWQMAGPGKPHQQVGDGCRNCGATQRDG